MLKQVIVLFLLLFMGCGERRDLMKSSWLNAKDGWIYNESGEKIQLKGMSTHGIAWYPHYYNKASMRWMKEDWKINLFRIAMYTEEWGGYISKPETNKDKVNELVQHAIDLGIYVIIDWHILRDGNPRTHENEAKKFFFEMSKKWADYPNVIYEICNEPNGWVNWYNGIRDYANAIIPIIRQNSPKALIIVGTGTWSQDIQDAASAPLGWENVAYALHFYAGTHGDWLMNRISDAKAKKATIFVSEWGVSEASGSGGVYREASQKWLDFLEKEGISWANWSLAPKNESSAALRENADPFGNWQESDLSESGRWVRNYLRSHSKEK